MKRLHERGENGPSSQPAPTSSTLTGVGQARQIVIWSR